MGRFYTVKAIVKKELTQLVRYPTWIIQMLIWPLIFPLAYVLPGLSMAGTDGSGFQQFSDIAGTNSFMGFVVIGTMDVVKYDYVELWDINQRRTDERNFRIKLAVSYKSCRPAYWRSYSIHIRKSFDCSNKYS